MASPTSEESSPKRIKALLEDDDLEDGSASGENGKVSVTGGEQPAERDGFNINEEFARRFEHNKRREELHRCE